MAQGSPPSLIDRIPGRGREKFDNRTGNLHVHVDHSPVPSGRQVQQRLQS
jgi:hypothetical protein